MRAVGIILALFCARARAADFSPYPQLDFAVSAARIAARCQAAKSRAQAALDAVAQIPSSARDFSNTPEAVENILDDLNDATAGDAFLENVAVSSDVRKAASQCHAMLEDFGAYTGSGLGGRTFSREDIFNAVKSYAASAPALSPIQERLLAREIADFKRGGMELSPESRAVLSAIRERIIILQEDFDQNLSADSSYLLVSSAELSGLPQNYADGLSRVGGKYKIGLDYPDYFPFMNDAVDADARRRLEFLFDNRAAAANVGIMEETLRLRDQAAHILGYPDHASYMLETRMAKTPDAVESFLKRLQKNLRPAGLRELAVLKKLKAADKHSILDGVIHAWDWRYYDNDLKKTKYRVDGDVVRRYFPLGRVLSGMFQVYETLFGVKFRRIAGAAAWAPDVDLYEIRNSRDNRIVGYFYLDLFPRPGKYTHMASFDIIDGRRLADGSYQKPVSALVGNFPRPAPGRPSLLSYGEDGEVSTLFHEFGHIMHQALTRAPYERFSGSNVAQDFVEAPAQMMENFIWRPEVLALISGDYRNPEKKLPPDLLKKILAARRVDQALKNLRQIFFSRLDMRYHSDPLVSNPTAVYQEMMRRVSLIPMTPGTNPEASFGHLMDGYDAGYYGYLWSKVYAQDMFERFKAEGALNPAIGWLYRKEILEPGSSRGEADSIKAFLGRSPSDKAFLKDLGISTGG
ncbi:MAG: M3 family metallopeptidase [Elusimicrobiota bacterium]